MAANRDKIIDRLAAASVQGADLVLFGELASLGAPLFDLVSHPDFTDRCMSALSDIADAEGGRACMSLIGMPTGDGDDVFDSVCVVAGGKMADCFSKAMPPQPRRGGTFFGNGRSRVRRAGRRHAAIYYKDGTRRHIGSYWRRHTIHRYSRLFLVGRDIARPYRTLGGQTFRSLHNRGRMPRTTPPSPAPLKRPSYRAE